MPKYKPEVPEIAEKPSEADVNRWFESFAQMLEQNGFQRGNKVQLSAIKVLGTAPNQDEFSDAQEGPIQDPNLKKFNNYMCKRWARNYELLRDLPPVSGNALAPDYANYPGKSEGMYLDWLDNNIKDPLSEDFAYAEKERLYQMAKANRLYVAPMKGASVAEEFRYINVDQNGLARLLPETDKLHNAFKRLGTEEDTPKDEEIRRNSGMTPEGEADLFRKHNERFMDIRCLNMNQRGFVESYTTDANFPRELRKIAKPYLTDQRRQTVADMISADAVKNPDRYRTRKDQMFWSTLMFVSVLPEYERNPEQKKLHEQYGILVSDHFEVTMKQIEKRGLLGLMDAGRVKDGEGNVLTAASTRDKLALIARKAEEGNLVVDVPKADGTSQEVSYYRDIATGKIQEGSCRKQYINEMKRLTEELKGTGKRGSDAFVKLTGALDRTLTVWNNTSAKYFDKNYTMTQNMEEAFKALKTHAEAYLSDKSKLTKFSSTQLKRLRIINRILDLKDSLENGVALPANQHRDKIAEKLASGYAEECYNNKRRSLGMKLMTDRAARSEAVQKVKDSNPYKLLVNDKNTADLIKMVKTNHNNLYQKASKIVERQDDRQRQTGGGREKLM